METAGLRLVKNCARVLHHDLVSHIIVVHALTWSASKELTLVRFNLSKLSVGLESFASSDNIGNEKWKVKDLIVEDPLEMNGG